MTRMHLKDSEDAQPQGAGGSRNRSVVDLREDFGGTGNAADGHRSIFEMRSSRRKLGDWMIRLGLVLQVVFLFFVDWGTIAGMQAEPAVPWPHVIALIGINAMLLVAAWFGWTWMRRVQAR